MKGKDRMNGETFRILHYENWKTKKKSNPTNLLNKKKYRAERTNKYSLIKRSDSEGWFQRALPIADRDSYTT